MRTWIFSNPAQTLGSAAGRTYALPNEAPVMVGCIHVVLVTTATAGFRALVLRVLDASNNVLFECIQQGSFGPSVTGRQNWGAGMVGAVIVPYILNGMPDMSLPPLSQINVFDSGNIDVNDTIAVSATLGDH